MMDSLDNWVGNFNNWQRTDGGDFVTSKTQKLKLDNPTIANGTVSVTVMADATETEAGLYFRWNPGSTYKVVIVVGKDSSESQLKLEKRTNGAWANDDLASEAGDNLPGGNGFVPLTWYTLSISGDDAALSVSVNGKKVLEYTDSSPLLSSGDVKLISEIGGTSGGKVSFKNFKLTTELNACSKCGSSQEECGSSNDDDCEFVSGSCSARAGRPEKYRGKVVDGIPCTMCPEGRFSEDGSECKRCKNYPKVTTPAGQTVCSTDCYVELAGKNMVLGSGQGSCTTQLADTAGICALSCESGFSAMGSTQPTAQCYPNNDPGNKEARDATISGTCLPDCTMTFPQGADNGGLLTVALGKKGNMTCNDGFEGGYDWECKKNDDGTTSLVSESEKKNCSKCADGEYSIGGELCKSCGGSGQVNSGSKATQCDDCVMAKIGSSGEATKTVDMDQKFKCPTIVDKYNWSSDKHNRTYDDTFSVTQSNGKASVTRTGTSSGWGMDLRFNCCTPGTKNEFDYNATSDLSHHGTVGREGKGDNKEYWWGYDQDGDTGNRGYLAFGPNATDWGEGWGEATFHLNVEKRGHDNHEVRLEIYDATVEEILAYRALSRNSFQNNTSMEGFKLGFSTYGRKGHEMETRIWWKDAIDIWVEKVVVVMNPHSKGLVYEGEALSHARGRLYTDWPSNDTNWAEGAVYPDAWGAKTNDYANGFLAYGPYATNWGEGSGKATFWLAVDENNNSNVIATLSVYDSTDNAVVAERQIKRNDFRSEKAYQPFTLSFTMKPGKGGHSMETRVQWKDDHHLWLDKVDVVITP